MHRSGETEVEAGRPCAYGKLPLHGDYVRLHGQAPEMTLLDQWFQEGLPRCAQRRMRTFEADFDGLPCLRFVFTPQTGHTLIGVVMPSRDRSGRRYPFLLAMRLPTPPPEEHDLLPLAADDFLGQAEAFVGTGWQELDLASLSTAIQAMQWTPDVVAAAAAHRAFLQATAPAALFQGMQGDGARRAVLMHDLASVLKQPWPPRLLLHLPTSGLADEIVFWQTFGRRCSPAVQNPTLRLWSRPDAGRPGVLRLIYDGLSARYLEAALWPDREYDVAYDLAHRRGAPAARVREAEAAMGPALREPVLRDLLGVLRGHRGA